MEIFKGKGKSGYRNIGNTCYLNASLSSIGNCLALTKYFLQDEFKKDIGPKNLERTREFSFLMSYINTTSCFYETNRTVVPRTVYEKLLGLYPNFSKNRQEDAYMCIIGILDTLNSSLAKNMKQFVSDKKIHKHLVESRKVFYSHFKDTYSIMTELFFGQYIQKVKCTKCNFSSYSYQPFIGINLNIPNDSKLNILSIYDILNGYFKNQTLEKTCEQTCKKTTVHVLKTKVIKLPKYLIIHFKRFDNNNKKINNTIAFASDLDMSDYTLPYETQSIDYELVSVINHIGDTKGGHYNTSNRIYDGTWVNIDDESVIDISPTDVCTKNAYILFYERNEI